MDRQLIQIIVFVKFLQVDNYNVHYSVTGAFWVSLMLSSKCLYVII